MKAILRSVGKFNVVHQRNPSVGGIQRWVLWMDSAFFKKKCTISFLKTFKQAKTILPTNWPTNTHTNQETNKTNKLNTIQKSKFLIAHLLIKNGLDKQWFHDIRDKLWMYVGISDLGVHQLPDCSLKLWADLLGLVTDVQLWYIAWINKS